MQVAAAWRRLVHAPPLRLFVAFLVVYGLTAGPSLARHSLAPHYVYLAESFLHGRLDLIHIPAPPYDLTPVAGRWYVAFPPLPALLLLPAVASWGLAVSDIAFSVLMGAGSVALFYLALARAECSLALHWERGTKTWLCVLLGLGSPLWYCAALGSVWYTAHVVAVVCLCLTMLEVFGRNRPWVAGLYIGLAFLARGPAVLAFPLPLALGLGRARTARGALLFVLLFGLGLAPMLAGQAAYNFARFGDPLEFGYRWMNSPDALQARMRTWGQFSMHFLPENLYTLTVRPPLLSWRPLHMAPDPWGMGLLFTMPALLLALRRRRATGTRWQRTINLGLWLSVILVAAPSLLYFNTGSYQFGYRFALDWLPLGILGVGIAAGAGLGRTGRALIIIGVLMYLWGVLWMYPNFNGQPWWTQYLGWLQSG